MNKTYCAYSFWLHLVATVDPLLLLAYETSQALQPTEVVLPTDNFQKQVYLHM